jgi:ubiquinone/menaquinone biosynthesis C-methylase UbiE
MDKAEYENIYRNEESHFYYVSLHKLVLTFLKRYKHGRNLSILDAGCGTGRLAQLMQRNGSVSAVDASNEAIRFAKMRGIMPLRASVMELPFKNNSFDVVTSIDVIYHKGVTDDRKALQEMYRVLKKGGILIIRVQANPWLSLSHDRHVHGVRRYTKKCCKIY